MVIITTLVAKVYFPASLERGSIPNIRRKYAYRRRRPTMEEEEEEEHSDADHDDDDELEALYSDEDDDENDNNNAEEEAEEEDRALEYEQDEEPLVADRTGRRRTTGSGTSRAAATTRPLEFDQVHTSQVKVLQRLVLCCLMLQATFVTWGALQERMLTRRYPRHTGDYFTYS